jgi:diguanylate cyclase (GGDEF)-like protein
MVDMDNLKPFNDLLGHEVGDTVIRIVARELVAGSRTNDFVGRIGGDEFVLVMEGVGADEALRVAGRIHTALSGAHFEIENAPEPISVSVGIASCPLDAETMDELLRRADRAMYAAKALGGGRSALARDRAESDTHTHSIGRAGRLTDVLLRSATGNASEAQRTAIALADRYAALAAERLALDPSVLPALRTLVIASAVRRLDDPGQRQEVAVTRALLGAVDASTFVDPANAAQVQAIAEGSVELAWVQTPGVSSTSADTEEAVRELDALLARPDARAARQALASVARGDTAERRQGNRVA